MKSHLSKTLALVLLASGSALPLASQAQSLATTQGGQVRGVEDNGTTAFRGIPFARPPVGALRWRAPESAAPWTGVRDAASFAPSCLQAPRKDGPGVEVSEDCLYLNIWRPAGEISKAKLPVMVWIYGGGNITGSTAWPVYSGAPLAKDGVIVVTLNYRLGYFGLFAHPELTRESAGHGTANFALMDQIAALKWVQANIAFFGGDPANVTIFGESAGGSAVNNLMVSPLAHGLFAKAITQSSSMSRPFKTLAAAEASGTQLAIALGAPTLAQLRTLPAERILEAADHPPPGGAPAAALDGVFLTDSPRKVFEAGHEAKVPWIIGNVDAETASLQSEQSRLGYLDGLPKPLLTEVTAAYEPDHAKDRNQLSIAVTTDISMKGPARSAAALHAAHGAPTYRYIFAYVPEAARERLSSAHHGSDIPFTLNTLGARAVGDIAAGGSAEHPMTVAFSDNDWKISRTFGRYLTNFAKTGDPNGPGLARWEPDRPDVVLLIDPSGFRSAPNLRKRELDTAANLPSR